jgi:hypothetical protein
MGVAHTQEYVTIKEDGNGRYDAECLHYKYSKRHAWMFHRTIVFSTKELATF